MGGTAASPLVGDAADADGAEITGSMSSISEHKSNVNASIHLRFILGDDINMIPFRDGICRELSSIPGKIAYRAGMLHPG